MKTNFIDLHCHPAMKPFGKSFHKKPGKNTSRRRLKESIWHYDPPRVIDKIANIALTITKFSQADFSTLSYGGAHVVFASLYPMEKGFVLNKMGDNLPADLLKNFVMGIGKKRIDHLQKMTDYFTDLEMVYNYYRQLDGKVIQLDGQRSRYKIVNSFGEIENDLETGIDTVYVILTIEGANVFNTGLHLMNIPVNEAEVLGNIDKVKKWEKRLFFITMTHHFYNDICGHAKSIGGISESVHNQQRGLGTGFTDLGLKVLDKLLDDSEGKRVLIDVKHMSVQSRKEYYKLLETNYAGEKIPLIVSHGAVAGYRSADEKIIDNQNTYGMFQDGDINFYDDELVKVARSEGIFGIQLDERRSASELELKKAGKRISRRKMLFHRSKFIWNQIQHIAETLDRQGLYAWGIQSIGSDFDGLIDPINGYWSAEQMGLLDSYLEKHAYNFLSSPAAKNLKSFNQISADEIIDRFMHDNAWEFLRRNF
jgi:microsomal dipeptidase-like Zn-dependent dipeptidase